MKKQYWIAFIVSAAVATTSCTKTQNQDNQLSSQETSEGWKLLFNGETTDGWHLYNNKEQKTSVWNVENGELVCKPKSGAEHGDLITEKTFENFELVFDWKISEAGNSGVFINVLEQEDIPTAWASGPEYQILDLKHHDYEKELKRSGCLFNISPQRNPVDQKPAGQWNQSRIVQKNGKIEFYLNQTLTVQQDFTTQEWRDTVANTNFKQFPEFGKRTSGHIALQDWNLGIAFKNIKIRTL